MATPNMTLTASNIDKAVLIGALETATISEADYISFYDVSAVGEAKQRKIPFDEFISVIKTYIDALPSAEPSDAGKPVVVGPDGAYGLGATLSGTAETFLVSPDDWDALANSSPYYFTATKIPNTVIGENSTVELINNSPVIFARYGLAILYASDSIVQFIAHTKPDIEIVMKVIVHG